MLWDWHYKPQLLLLKLTHDENGIKWLVAIAPYHVLIVPVNIKDELQWNTANELYTKFQQENIEVVLDDRDERAGVKFKDADLIGYPIRITVGKTINEGKIELKIRSTGEQSVLPVEEALQKVKEILR